MALCQHFMYHMFLSQYFKYSTFLLVFGTAKSFSYGTLEVLKCIYVMMVDLWSKIRVFFFLYEVFFFMSIVVDYIIAVTRSIFFEIKFNYLLQKPIN